jgi:hypothetical protein
MSPSSAEQSHELGRRGVVRIKNLLWKILGSSIDLPFNAYDHAPKLTFDDSGSGNQGRFTFDLGGILRRKNTSRVDSEETVEVFVEVKSTQSADNLLKEYREFLRRAAVVSSDSRHHDTWFMFVAQVPFGSTYGTRLCNGGLLDDCRERWPSSFSAAVRDINERVTLFIATESFQRLVDHWGRGRDV